MTPTRPVLRYFGGKWVMAPWIIDNMPAHRVYVEPFGGAASVLMRKPRARYEVYNDLDSEIVNVFRVLQSRKLYRELVRKLRYTPFSREEYNLAHSLWTPGLLGIGEDPVELARRTIVKSFMGHGADSLTSQYRSGFRAVSRNNNRVAPMDWINYAPAVPAMHRRLMGVVIECKDAFDVMTAQDAPDTLHLVDPPYVHETRSTGHSYRFEMDAEAHVKLLNFIKGLTGMVMICGYPHPSYEQLGWARLERRSYADGGNERVECLWLNEAAWSAQDQITLL